MNMTIWVSKEPSGPQDRIWMSFNIILEGLIRFLARATVGALALWITLSVSMSVSLFLFSTCSLVQVTANENHLKSREVAL